ILCVNFFFSSRRRHTRSKRDWSSDVCSSDLSGRVLQMAQKTTPKKPMNEDPRFAQAVQNYEAGLRAMQEHKFDKAKSHLQKVIAGPSKELTDRANVHMNTCSQHLERSTTQFKT